MLSFSKIRARTTYLSALLPILSPFPRAVGLMRRAVNADLFRAADLSFSIEGLPLNQPLSSLPVASASRFSAIDSAFNSSIVGLHTALPLGDVVSVMGLPSAVRGCIEFLVTLIGRCLAFALRGPDGPRRGGKLINVRGAAGVV